MEKTGFRHACRILEVLGGSPGQERTRWFGMEKREGECCATEGLLGGDPTIVSGRVVPKVPTACRTLVAHLHTTVDEEAVEG